jgi:hypothetical protein
MVCNFYIKCDDGKHKLCVVDPERYTTHTLTREDNHIVYHRLEDGQIEMGLTVDGGLWVLEGPIDEGGEHAWGIPQHPIHVAFHFQAFKRPLPPSLEPFREFTSNGERYRAWVKDHPKEKFVVARRTIVPGAEDEEPPEGWIYTSQRALGKHLGFSGSQARHIEILKQQGVIKTFEYISNGKWKVVLCDRAKHDEAKQALTPKPRNRKTSHGSQGGAKA